MALNTLDMGFKGLGSRPAWSLRLVVGVLVAFKTLLNSLSVLYQN